MAEDFESLLALLRRNTDEFGWLQPLLDDPDSQAALGGMIAIFARLGDAVIHDRDAGLISAASAGQLGSCSVTVSRSTAGTSGTIPRGYTFADARGCVVRTQTDVPVGVGLLSVILPCQTDRESELVNTVDPPVFVVSGPPVLDGGGLVNLIAPPGDLASSNTTFVATGATPIAGGAADYLSVHGSERGKKRQPGETEADYRARIRNVSDAVSPFAVADYVTSASQQAGLPAFLTLEPFQDGADPVAKALHYLGNFDVAAYDAAADGTADFLDDAQGPEMADRRTVRAYFRIEAQDYVRDEKSGAMFLDAGFYDDPLYGYADAWINFPPVALGAILGMTDGVRAVKAGGVAFDVYLRAPDTVYGIGESSSNVSANVFAISPPTGSAWFMVEATAGHDSPNPVVGAMHRLQFSFYGGDVYTTDWYTPSDTQRIPVLGRIVTQIVGVVQSDGTIPLNLVGTFSVHVLKNFP